MSVYKLTMNFSVTRVHGPRRTGVHGEDSECLPPMQAQRAEGLRVAHIHTKGKHIHLGDLFLIIATKLVPITRTNFHYNPTGAGDKLWDIGL